MIVIKTDITDLQKIPGLEKSLVVIGKFDGIHNYHEKLIKIATKLAIENYLQLVVLTFDNSFNLLNQNIDDQMMSSAEKEAIFEDYFAIDYYIELKVNQDLQSYDKKQFMNWLKKTLKCQKLVEGTDFTFGKDKKGTIEDLKAYFGPENVYAMKRKPHTTSSTKIRELIKKGKIKKANSLLHSPFKLYLENNNKSLKKITFPHLEVCEGYYECLINDQIKATVLVTNQTVSLLQYEQQPTENIEYVTLIKYLGKIIT